MKTGTWYYYNHAMLPYKAPHEKADTTIIKDGSIWQNPNKPLLARWTTDFDCGYETEWWYCIKDKPFDIYDINAKRRYEINKGKKYFETRIISPIVNAESMFRVQKCAYNAYPKKYRPSLNHDAFMKKINDSADSVIIGAFSRETGVLSGYAMLIPQEHCISLSALKTDPACEKYGINAALVNSVLEKYQPHLNAGGYISDGERNITHETAFQSYLERYFGFHKAYCHLHVAYRNTVKPFVLLAYPFRRWFKPLDGISFFHQLRAVLQMEEIIRRQKGKMTEKMEKHK